MLLCQRCGTREPVTLLLTIDERGTRDEYVCAECFAGATDRVVDAAPSVGHDAPPVALRGRVSPETYATLARRAEHHAGVEAAMAALGASEGRPREAFPIFVGPLAMPRALARLEVDVGAIRSERVDALDDAAGSVRSALAAAWDQRHWWAVRAPETWGVLAEADYAEACVWLIELTAR